MKKVAKQPSNPFKGLLLWGGLTSTAWLFTFITLLLDKVIILNPEKPLWHSILSGLGSIVRGVFGIF